MGSRSFADGRARRKYVSTSRSFSNWFSVDPHPTHLFLVCSLSGKQYVADLDSDYQVRIDNQTLVFRVFLSLARLGTPKEYGTLTRKKQVKIGEIFPNPGENITC